MTPLGHSLRFPSFSSSFSLHYDYFRQQLNRYLPDPAIPASNCVSANALLDLTSYSLTNSRLLRSIAVSHLHSPSRQQTASHLEIHTIPGLIHKTSPVIQLYQSHWIPRRQQNPLLDSKLVSSHLRSCWLRAYKRSSLASPSSASLLPTPSTANLDTHLNTTSYASYKMSASALPQGFSIFQPVLGAQLQFFPAVGTQELDELIHAHLLGPASSQEKRATLALDFLEHAQLTGQSFKFYPVYAASPAVSASSSFNTSPAATTWDWSQTSRTASVSSSRSSQNRVTKAASPTSRMRTTDFSSLPGMKIMTKDGLDVTNSASRGSKTKEQRDHAHLMRIIKACDSCKRKKIRCDPSHKKRSAPVQGTSAAAATAKVTKKARTASPAASQPVSPPQSISPASVSPPNIGQDFSLTASPFDVDATFSFDALDAFDPTLAAPADLWDEFVQFPPMDYDFFADPESYLSSQASSDAEASASQQSASVSPTHSGAPPERGPDDWFAEALESRAQVFTNAPQGSFTPQLPYDSPGSGGDYADFNLYSPGSSFSEDERMLDISSSTSGLSTMPSPSDSPPRPPRSAQSPGSGVTGVSVNGAAVEAPSPFTWAEEEAIGAQRGSLQPASLQAPSPFTLAEEAGEAEIADTRASAADRDNMLGALRVQSRSDIVMRTDEHGQLIICCPPGTTVVNSQASSGDGVTNVSPNPIPPHSCKAKPQRLTLKKTNTGIESSSSSFSIRSELSVCIHGYPYPTTATNPMKENAVASVSAPAAAANVDSSITTWLDHGEGGQGRSPTPFASISSIGDGIQTELTDGVTRRKSSRFVHRDTDLAEEREETNGSIGFAFESQSQVLPSARLGSGSSLSSSAISPTVGQSLVSSSLSAALPLVSVDGDFTSSASGSRSSTSASDFSTSASGFTSDSGLASDSGLSISDSGSASASDLSTSDSDFAPDSGFSISDSGFASDSGLPDSDSCFVSDSGFSASGSASGSASDSGACARDNTSCHATSAISSLASDNLSAMLSTSALDSDDVSSSSSSSSVVTRALRRVETIATKSSLLPSETGVATSSDFSASLSSDSAISQFTELTDQSTTAEDSTEPLASSLEHSVSSPSLALATGRSVHYLDPSSVDVSRVIAGTDTLASSDVAGVASSNVQDTFTPADFITAMQTVITRTLAAYMQSTTALASRTVTRPNQDSARARRVYNSSLLNMMMTKPSGLVSVVC